MVTTDSDGTIVKYVYGNGLISSYETTTDKTEYQTYSYDLRGSVISVSDENGSITAEYTYSTYGERTVIEGEATVFGYCARETSTLVNITRKACRIKKFTLRVIDM